MKMRVLLCLTLIVFSFSIRVSGADNWTQVRSKNFHLIGNANEKDIRKVATKLEQFREVFRQILPKMKFTSAIPTTVIVFKNDNAYKPFKPVRADGKTDKWIAGYFQPGDDVNYITLSTESRNEEVYDTIFHEYVHFLVDANLGRSNIPPWFNEGLAEYYATFRMEGDQKAILGSLQEGRLFSIQDQKLIPFEQFFAIDNLSLRNQGNHGKDVFYAQAWALMHYFNQSNAGARRPQLNKFLNLLLNNKPPREAFQEAFQMDYAAMEKELRKYVEQRSFTANFYEFKEKLVFDAEMQSAPLSEAEANAYLGDLLLHTNRADEAAARLQQALALDANSSLAHAALGNVLMRQRKFADAKKHLEKAIALDAKNHMTHYYYAYAVSREAMDENGFVINFSDEAVQKMRASLKKAVEINPNFPESYRLLAFISLVNNDALDEGIAALKKALTLQPGNQWYTLDIAQLYARKEDFTAARILAEKLVATAGEPQIRTVAQSVLNNINRMQEQTARIKEFNERGGAAPTLGGNGERQIAVEIPPDATPEEALNIAINDALRKPQAGEQRALGFLTEIECGSKGSAFVVRADAQTLKLRVPPSQNVMIMAFSQDAGQQQFGCGKRNPENFVVATFKPSDDAKAKTNGELISLEIVPKTFKLKP